MPLFTSTYVIYFYLLTLLLIGPGQQQQQQSGPTGGGGQWDTSFGAENCQGAQNPSGQNGVYRKTSLEQQLNINLQPSGNAQTQNLDDIINTHSPFIPRGKPGIGLSHKYCMFILFVSQTLVPFGSCALSNVFSFLFLINLVVIRHLNSTKRWDTAT